MQACFCNCVCVPDCEQVCLTQHRSRCCLSLQSRQPYLHVSSFCFILKGALPLSHSSIRASVCFTVWLMLRQSPGLCVPVCCLLSVYHVSLWVSHQTALGRHLAKVTKSSAGELVSRQAHTNLLSIRKLSHTHTHTHAHTRTHTHTHAHTHTHTHTHTHPHIEDWGMTTAILALQVLL